MKKYADEFGVVWGVVLDRWSLGQADSQFYLVGWNDTMTRVTHNEFMTKMKGWKATKCVE